MDEPGFATGILSRLQKSFENKSGIDNIYGDYKLSIIRYYTKLYSSL